MCSVNKIKNSSIQFRLVIHVCFTLIIHNLITISSNLLYRYLTTVVLDFEDLFYDFGYFLCIFVYETILALAQNRRNSILPDKVHAIKEFVVWWEKERFAPLGCRHDVKVSRTAVSFARGNFMNHPSSSTVARINRFIFTWLLPQIFMYFD